MTTAIRASHASPGTTTRRANNSISGLVNDALVVLAAVEGLDA